MTRARVVDEDRGDGALLPVPGCGNSERVNGDFGAIVGDVARRCGFTTPRWESSFSLCTVG